MKDRQFLEKFCWFLKKVFRFLKIFFCFLENFFDFSRFFFHFLRNFVDFLRNFTISTANWVKISIKSNLKTNSTPWLKLIKETFLSELGMFFFVVSVHREWKQRGSSKVKVFRDLFDFASFSLPLVFFLPQAILQFNINHVHNSWPKTFDCDQ